MRLMGEIHSGICDFENPYATRDCCGSSPLWAPISCPKLPVPRRGLGREVYLTARKRGAKFTCAEVHPRGCDAPLKAGEEPR
jgi:hypothetical protein